MKKILLSAALLAACGAMQAQKLTYVPWQENALMCGTAMSDNGRYVGGSDTEGRAFIYDMETGEIKYFVSPNLSNPDLAESAQASIRAIANDGVGVGYIEDKAAKFDFATGNYSDLLDESIEDFSLARHINADGSVICGVTYDNSYKQRPFVIADGKMSYLPEFTDSWTGYETNGFIATASNNDGSVILGSVIDNFATYPLMIWVRNRDNSTYSAVLSSKRFFDGSENLDGSQPYDEFCGTAISANGKWAVVNYKKKDPYWQYNYGECIARYDIEADSVQYITCPDASMELYYSGYAIANDGTIVGVTEDQITSAQTAIICKAGETTAQPLSEAFPSIKELADMEGNDLSIAASITPDGRYITGYGYVDFNDDSLCYGTWRLDTKSEEGGETGVENAAQNGEKSEVVASYGVDGRKVNRQSARNILRIDKLANGKTVKTVK